MKSVRVGGGLLGQPGLLALDTVSQYLSSFCQTETEGNSHNICQHLFCLSSPSLPNQEQNKPLLVKPELNTIPPARPSLCWLLCYHRLFILQN